MAIIDCILYNGEEELWDLRYHILKDFVDGFIVCECNKTFSGKDKPIYFTPELYLKYEKVYFYEIDDNNPKLWEQAKLSPNTEYGKGAKHWLREWVQKEQIKLALTHLKDDDIVFISDCDEIIDPKAIKIISKILKFLPNGAIKFKLRVYTYWLNNKSNEQFWGTLCTTYKRIKEECLNHLRTDKNLYNEETVGWHFTSMAKSLKQKLKDSYTEEDYATDEILDNLDENIKNNRDFLARDFKYTKDESQWPDYLKENKAKYGHLMK